MKSELVTNYSRIGPFVVSSARRRAVSLVRFLRCLASAELLLNHADDRSQQHAQLLVVALHAQVGRNSHRRLAAPRSIEPRVPITPRTLRSVSLSHPLSSLSDEVVKAPNVWAVRRPSNDKIVSMLTGCAENTPRLAPFDRTRASAAAGCHKGHLVCHGLLPARVRPVVDALASPSRDALVPSASATRRARPSATYSVPPSSASQRALVR